MQVDPIIAAAWKTAQLARGMAIGSGMLVSYSPNYGAVTFTEVEMKKAHKDYDTDLKLRAPMPSIAAQLRSLMVGGKSWSLKTLSMSTGATMDVVSAQLRRFRKEAIITKSYDPFLQAWVYRAEGLRNG